VSCFCYFKSEEVTHNRSLSELELQAFISDLRVCHSTHVNM